MKKLFYYLIVLIVSFCFAWSSQAQTKLIQQSDGTYVSESVKTTEAKAVDTGLIFVGKNGEKYPIMRGPKGGTYIVRTSKSGKTYRQYVKLPE